MYHQSVFNSTSAARSLGSLTRPVVLRDGVLEGAGAEIEQRSETIVAAVDGPNGADHAHEVPYTDDLSYTCGPNSAFQPPTGQSSLRQSRVSIENCSVNIEVERSHGMAQAARLVSPQRQNSEARFSVDRTLSLDSEVRQQAGLPFAVCVPAQNRDLA
jgi:hypothetical protein